jgi:hypothetical protein
LFRTLGIAEKHTQSLIDSEIDVPDLKSLTEEDLTELIPVIGPRRKLQAHIKQM